MHEGAQKCHDDLIITFNCNPKWTLVLQEGLKIGHKPQDRYDIIGRIFHIKVKKMVNFLTKKVVFLVPSRCYVYTVEWQKRGLPHIHILLWLEDRIKPVQIDSVISLKIPNAQVDPKFHDIVKSTIIHHLCGTLKQKLVLYGQWLLHQEISKPLVRIFDN